MCVCVLSKRALSSEEDEMILFVSNVSFFSLLVFEEEKKKKISSSRNLFFYYKSTTPNDEDSLSFLSKCFSDWCKSYLVRRSKKNVSEKKKTRKAETTHLRDIIIVVIVFII